MKRAKSLFIYSLCAVTAGFSTPSLAVTNPAVPSSSDPGRVLRSINIPEQRSSLGTEPYRPPQEQKTQMGKEAEKIKFDLTNIILEGNTLYPEKPLKPLYANYLNKKISLADLQVITDNITNYYRNNGYVLSRAILPPQKVIGGVIHIHIIEGHVDKVTLIGTPGWTTKIMTAYGKHISDSKPLQIKVMERYLRLANEIPGAQAKAVLEPSASKVGAADMSMDVKARKISAYLSYDNYGTEYMGPLEATAMLSVNSLIRSGDTTRGVIVSTTRPKELRYTQISHQTPIGTTGLQLTLGHNRSQTRPGLNLRPLQIEGDAKNYYTSLTYPLLRARDQNLTIDGTFNYMDSVTDSLGTLLYVDHIRSLKLGLDYDNLDRFHGRNNISTNLEEGLNWFGATSPNSLNSSRTGGNSVFTTLNIQASRLQPLFWRFSLYGQVNGQYSYNPLLAPEQFGFGGSQLGRGYDPSEITGDKGIAGTLEFRTSFTPSKPETSHWNAVQLYMFYDQGVVWNLKNVSGIKSKQSAASTGIGARLFLNSSVFGNVFIAQPLTKGISAFSTIHKARKPRIQFSISFSV